ncbi:vitamin B12/cobalamin outer membrane transporter [bacterium BMS3Abin03]|nr:vitamin B12/cobalamin outer membrane transporter [bacterium BMS3Abin03]
MKSSITKLAAGIFLLLFTIPLLAQTGVGKLNGKVIDADTKEPLIGANVLILNTGMGAATDLDGNYFILNITPGTYAVKVSYVGYAPKTINNVRIVAGVTYELNVELSTDFSLPEIVVEDKKFFEPNATNTVKVIDADQISRLPVRGVSNFVALQSGVVVQEGSGGADGNATINVRGGRGSEILYIVDGIPQNNLYNRTSVAQVSNIAIDQISFQVGGYEAKYGEAQSGIVNVTTKSGQPYYSAYVDILSSSYTDDYGYNLYSGSLSGPLIPGIPEHTVFLSLERGWFKDANPPAIKLEFPSINKTYDFIPNNPANVWRASGKINSRFGGWRMILSGLWNKRTAKSFDLRKIKNDAAFQDEFYQENTSTSLRISQTVSNSTFWNLTLGYRLFDFERYNPFFNDGEHIDNLLAYGDSTIWASKLGVNLLGDGRRTDNLDENGVFRPYGYSTGIYQRREDDAITADLDFTSQIDKHLLEFGAGFSSHTVRGYGIFAYRLAAAQSSLSIDEKFINEAPFVFGYDYTGKNKTNGDEPRTNQLLKDVGSDPSMNEFIRPRKPVIAYTYLQDRFELEDLVLNVGLRLDYFDIKSFELKDPSLPYAGGLDPTKFDIQDFKIKDVEVEISPRIGIGFPVTSSTVFHAQYGRFIQMPELNDMYAGPFSYDRFISYEPQFGRNGGLRREETTQYEIGFRQLMGDNSALNITLFYKNIKGLVNDQNHKFRRTPGGEVLNAIYSENADFGTTKGFAFSFDVTRLSYFSLSLQYTYSLAEGTGSSTSSSQTAVFRNNNNQPPKVIAPLSFDQRHTGVLVVDFYIPEGKAGIWEMLNINALFSFNSGRPYTPTDNWNLLGDNGLSANNTGYVNSAYGPGSFRIDIKAEKSFPVGNFYIVPYVWIENLLGSINVTRVYRSTGDPYTTGYLNTPGGRSAVANNGEGFAQDYRSLERNPSNFGIPRLIKLGVKLNFARF